MLSKQPSTVIITTSAVTAAATTSVNTGASKTQVKGFAALANKLNTSPAAATPTLSNCATSNGFSKLASTTTLPNGNTSKVNHDEIFNKFRQSASSSQLKSNSAELNSNAATTTGLDLKKKFQFLETTGKLLNPTANNNNNTAATSQTTTNSTQQAPKKASPLFTLSSSNHKSNLILNSIKK
jgi:hypothetical protein